MKLPSHRRGSREGRCREWRGSTPPASARDRTAVRQSLASCVSSSSNFSSYSGAPAADASDGRVTEVPRERGRTKKKARAEKRDKRTRSKKSRKKKHRKKRHRVSSSCSSSSPCFRSSSRSRSHSPPSSCTDQSRNRSPAAPSSVCQRGGLYNRKVTGWDVGPEVLETRTLPARAQHSTSDCGDGGNSFREKTALHVEQEKCQQHDAKTYEKAFGVAIPSGQYAFVSEETDLAVFLPGAGRGQANTSVASVGALSSSPTGTALAGGSDPASADRFSAAPPALGVLRLLKEADVFAACPAPQVCSVADSSLQQSFFSVLIAVVTVSTAVGTTQLNTHQMSFSFHISASMRQIIARGTASGKGGYGP